MTQILSWLKPLLGAFILITLLQVTGLMGSVSSYAQSALLKTGVRNAKAKTLKNAETFDFNFTIRDLNGKRVPFEKYKGKVIFLNLWATWCGPCRGEMPTIQSLYEKVDTSAVKFVILSIDCDSDEAKVGKFVSQYNYTLPIYRPSGYLTKQLDVDYIPTTLIISKEGKIVSKEIGGTNFDTAKFRKYLLSLTQ